MLQCRKDVQFIFQMTAISLIDEGHDIEYHVKRHARARRGNHSLSCTLGACEKMFYDGNYVKNFAACLRLDVARRATRLRAREKFPIAALHWFCRTSVLSSPLRLALAVFSQALLVGAHRARDSRAAPGAQCPHRRGRARLPGARIAGPGAGKLALAANPAWVRTCGYGALRGARKRQRQAMMSSMHGSRGSRGSTLNRPWWVVTNCMRHSEIGTADVHQLDERSVFASATLRF